ncbi:NAD-dependent epimerase/dehydratase [Klebsormidium nitens]|uniref:NAD-dependent epimerase/dehydratase n=1 Tax=Klebsormidium nitens TaxID=105231 RepID=A0A1Y1IG01_KLENI|nr:NAD-dependent epimerase/dehydratase [Klebsormidium nitens]|eukprot:GAQ89764.1 NAD-dependent epimerase/dehydratase [Klebsormidium nitens]
MTILISGGAGFLGQRLARALIKDQAVAPGPSNEQSDGGTKLLLVDILEPVEPIPGAQHVTGDITDPSFLASVLTEDVTSIFHLAAIVSSHAESDYDLGMKVNFDATRAIVERARALKTRPTLIFTSSVAVFGIPRQELHDANSIRKRQLSFTETTAITPQSSYGAEKGMAELLVADATRKGFIDGRAVRLPTVVVRPGKPNKAASSFASGIIREPLQGQPSVCPVDLDTPVWIQSPRKVVENLIRAHKLPAGTGPLVITLPGLSVTAGELVDAMVRAGGRRELVRLEKQPDIERIVSSWPGRIETPVASSLGFEADRSIDDVVQAFVQDDLKMSR